MFIIIKFILKNIKEKKFRTFLILFSLSLSCALYFSSNAVSTTLANMYLDIARNSFGSADIIIHAGESSPHAFFSTTKIYQMEDRLEYITGAIMTESKYKASATQRIPVEVKGFDFEQLEEFNPVTLVERENLLPFKGNKIIINNTFAQKQGLKLGQMLELEYYGVKFRFVISAIGDAKGILSNDDKTTSVIIPRDKLAALYEVKGRVNVAYLKVKEGEDKKQVIKDLQAVYKRYVVRETLSKKEVERYLNEIKIPFLVMTVFVLFISIFIIYTSFKVITMERLPIIGTFRSIGATQQTTGLLMVLESLSYGIIGGVIGCALGVIFLYLIIYIQSQDGSGTTQPNIKLDFSTFHLASSFLLAILLSLISSIVPIIKASRIPIKDVILNTMNLAVKKQRWKPALGLVLIVISLIVPGLVNKKIALFTNCIAIISVAAGVVLLIPLMTKLFVFIFEHVYVLIFGNIGTLAAKNMRENKNIINNISLLAIGISGLLMINTISYSVVNDLVNYYKDADFQLWLWIDEVDRSGELSVKSVKGVDKVYGAFSIDDINVVNKKNKLGSIHGINRRYTDYWKLNITPEQINELYDSRNILLSQSLKEKFSVEVGDSLVLKMTKGNKEYRVSGFFKSTRNGGNFALISDKYYKADVKYFFYSELYVKTSENPALVLKRLKKKYERRGFWGETITKMQANELLENRQLFVVLEGFSFITLIIAIFGIVNNLIISFIQRKRYLAIYRSVGMSRGQILSMLFLESLSGGIIGGLVGICNGIFLIMIVNVLLISLDMQVAITYSLASFINAMLSGIVITLIASISPAIRSSKLNIIEAVKYE